MTSSPGVETVLFDLDGTISDSAPGIVASLEHAYAALEIEAPTDLRSKIGPPLPVMLAELGLPVRVHEEFIAAYRGRYTTIGLFENTVYDGIPETLDSLEEAGIRLAIATSKPELFAVRILEYFGLADRFEFIAGASMDQSGRGRKADVIEHCLAHLPGAVSATTIMVGDRHHDIEGAAEHAIRAIGITWGYGSCAELVHAGAMAVIDVPAQLIAAILHRR